jgi:hypothetical protein
LAGADLHIGGRYPDRSHVHQHNDIPVTGHAWLNTSG